MVVAATSLVSGTAAAFEYFSVNQDSAVLSEPQPGSGVIAELSRGQILLQIDQQGEWSKVFFLSDQKQPLKGWLLSTAITASATHQPGLKTEETVYYISKVDKLRLRKGPGTQFQVVGALDLKQVVKRLHTEAGWMKVKYKTDGGNAAQAWTAMNYLKPVRSVEELKGESTSSTKLKPTVSGLYRVKGSKVNFRQGPGISFPVVGQLNHDQQVKVVAEKGEWKQINYDLLGREVSGWMVGSFLRPM